jgi:hypothetical protein
MNERIDRASHIYPTVVDSVDDSHTDRSLGGPFSRKLQNLTLRILVPVAHKCDEFENTGKCPMEIHNGLPGSSYIGCVA